MTALSPPPLSFTVNIPAHFFFSTEMLPFIEVSHLPSSSSFYSAITQPLSLRYISAGDAPGSPSLTYGFAPASIPVFELRQVAPTSRPLKRSRVILSASSPDVVGHFRAVVQRSKGLDGRAASFFDGQGCMGYPSDKAVETDLDGNVMEVVYIPPPGYSEGYAGSTVRPTQSGQNEASRILSWNYGVVVADPTMSLAPLSSRRRYADDDMAPVVRRSVTSTTTLVEPLDSSSLASPRQNANGSVSTSTVVGTLLGVAAAGAAVGAGVAYGMLRHDRPRGTEFEAPPFQRRSTFPEPYSGEGSRYSEYGPGGKDYVYGPGAPTLASRHSYGQAPQDDKASRPSSRFKQSSVAPSTRTRSDAPASRSQLLLTDAEHRSQASSRHSAKTNDLEYMVAADYRSHASASRQTSASRRSGRSQNFDLAAGGNGAASYVSARSHKTVSTVRPAGPQRQYTEPSEVSRATCSRISARDLNRLAGGSHAGGTRVSARNIALPRSGVGSSHAAWDKEDDDLDSIAPSDSISNVGSRKSERLYH